MRVFSGKAATSGSSRKAVSGAAWSVGVFYILVAFEFFYMATPFALYLYGAYLPGLESLNGVPALAWLTRFFLPHYVTTSSALVNAAAPAGAVLTTLGMVGFLIGAAQVYSRKLLKRGAALGGVYRLVRHPQYAALILAGAGMLLLWPRFLMVVFFVTMLFVYRALAAVEERECLERYGQAYADYLQRTPSFLPFRLPFRVPLADRLSTLPWSVRAAAWVLAFAVGLGGALAVAFLLQGHMLRSLFAADVGAGIYVSLAPLDGGTIERAARTAEADRRVRALLAGPVGEGARLIGYVMPWEWRIPEIPMNDARGHRTPDDVDRRRHKIVYTKAVFSGRANARGRNILRLAVRSEALGEAWIDEEGRVARVLNPPETGFYGSVPVPLL
jgi:protein-S-isoprenylcysteine O-methyltransferase Ste14